MISKSRHHLLLPEAINSLKTKLIPLSTMITPNLFEAEQLTGRSVSYTYEMLDVANHLLELGAQSVLLKGGHLEGHLASDFYVNSDGTSHIFEEERIITKNTHGTGCTLSAAIASCCALELTMIQSCQYAKNYLTKAIKTNANESVGHGAGPVHHFYHLWPTLNKI